MADWIIKRLKAGDDEPMRQLLGIFAEAFGEPEVYLGAQPVAAYLNRILAKESFVALVAESGGRILGGLIAYELEKFEQARSEFYIYDLAVLEPYRRQGIATALINALKSIARESGGYVIFVQADQGDEPAVRLYSKLGLREEVLHFDVRVD